jgi:hypothetical protein
MVRDVSGGNPAMSEPAVDLGHAYVDGRRGLNPNDFIRPNDPIVQAVALEIVRGLGDQDSAEARLREAYNFVTLNIKYVTDMSQFNYEEVWQLPDSTLRRRMGDCEDLAFLLVSLLRALHINAKMVFGVYKDEGHAWVWAQVDGASGILETTSGQPFTGFADPAGYTVEESYGMPYEASAAPTSPLDDPLISFFLYLAPGLVLFAVGAFLMIDDAQDAFKMELSESLTEGHPGTSGLLKGVTIPGLGPHIHHWWIGIILVMLGIVILAVGVLLWMLKYL